MQPLSVFELVSSAVAFVCKNPRAILSRALIPLAGGGIVLYASLSAFLTELANLLGTGKQHFAGLVLAAAAAGLLGFLFFHSVLRISLTALALGRETYTPWLYLQFARREWRLYAANLRGLALSVPLIVAVEFAVNPLTQAFPQYGTAMTWSSMVVLFLGLIVIEAGIFLVAPAVTLQERGQILRRAWRISREHLFCLALACVLLLVPGTLIENLSEVILKAIGQVRMTANGSSMGGAIINLREVLPELLLVLAIPYLATVALLTGAGARAYRILTDSASS